MITSIDIILAVLVVLAILTFRYGAGPAAVAAVVYLFAVFAAGMQHRFVSVVLLSFVLSDLLVSKRLQAYVVSDVRRIITTVSLGIAFAVFAIATMTGVFSPRVAGIIFLTAYVAHTRMITPVPDNNTRTSNTRYDYTSDGMQKIPG